MLKPRNLQEFGDFLGIDLDLMGITGASVSSVASFGAKGDGITDDTAAINAAIAAVAPTFDGSRWQGGGVVLFPAGQYLTTGGHVIPRSVVLCGVSAQAANILHSGNNVCFQHDGGSSIPNYQRPGISDLTIWGNSGAAAIGVEVRGKLWAFFLERVTISNYNGAAGIGLLVHNAAAGDFCEGVTASDLSLRYNTIGVQWKRTSGDASFAYQRFLNFDVHVPASGIGLDIGSSSTAVCNLNGGRFAGNIWLEGNNAVAVNIGANGNVLASTQWQVVGEIISGTGTKALAIQSGGQFAPRGAHDFIAGPTLDVASATLWLPPHRRDDAVIAQGLKGEAFTRQLVGGTQLLTAGTVQGALVALRRGDVVTNVVVGVSVNSTTPTLIKASVTSKTGTILAASADQQALFNTGSVPPAVVVPLSTPYTVPSDDGYYLEILCVGGTPPTLLRGANLSAGAVAVGSGVLPYEQSAGGQTDLVNHSINATGPAIWLGWS